MIPEFVYNKNHGYIYMHWRLIKKYNSYLCAACLWEAMGGWYINVYLDIHKLIHDVAEEYNIVNYHEKDTWKGEA